MATIGSQESNPVFPNGLSVDHRNQTWSFLCTGLGSKELLPVFPHSYPSLGFRNTTYIKSGLTHFSSRNYKTGYMYILKGSTYSYYRQKHILSHIHTDLLSITSLYNISLFYIMSILYYYTCNLLAYTLMLLLFPATLKPAKLGLRERDEL